MVETIATLPVAVIIGFLAGWLTQSADKVRTLTRGGRDD